MRKIRACFGSNPFRGPSVTVGELFALARLLNEAEAAVCEGFEFSKFDHERGKLAH